MVLAVLVLSVLLFGVKSSPFLSSLLLSVDVNGQTNGQKDVH